ERERRVAKLQRLAVDLRRPSRVVPEHLRGERDLDLAGVEQRLAGAETFQLRHLVEMLLDQVTETPDDPPALVRAHPRPRALVERLPGGRHRSIDVALVAPGDGVERLLVCGVDRLVHLAGRRGLPLAANEDLSCVHGLTPHFPSGGSATTSSYACRFVI